MIKVSRKDGESGERLLRRFSGHVKARRLPFRLRKLRYNVKPPTKKKIRETAIAREAYRAENKRKALLD